MKKEFNLKILFKTNVSKVNVILNFIFYVFFFLIIYSIIYEILKTKKFTNKKPNLELSQNDFSFDLLVLH